jgi:hypothetical protein
MSAYPGHDPEYLTTFDALILGRAEETLQEAHALVEGGFEAVQVVGLDLLLWKRDGSLFTRERALSLIWSIEEDA